MFAASRPAMARRVWICAGCAALLFGAAVPVAVAAPAPGAAPTSLWSQRLASILGTTALPQDTVSAAVAQVARHPNGWLSENAGVRLQPSSVAALFTDAATLADLGPGHQLETDVLATAPPARRTETGNLYLVGGGDFSLTHVSLRRMAAAVASKVRKVTGSVVFDDRALGVPGVPQGWTADLARDPYAVVPPALTVDQGQVTVTVKPAAPGKWASVTQEPAGAFRISGTILTTKSGKTSVSVFAAPGSRTLKVSGRMVRGSAARTVELAAPDPASAAAGQFLADLTNDGVQVAGGVRTGRAPKGAVTLTAHRSSSVAALVRAQLRTGSIGYAESLVRLAGLTVRGAATPLAGGLAAIDRVIAALGQSPLPGLLDGSGTSREDQVTAGQLAMLLAAAPGQSWGKMLETAIPPLAGFGRVDAVTGIAPGVAALAGYARPKNGPAFAFAFIANGTAGRQALTAERSAARLLAHYPTLPTASGKAPKGAPAAPKWTATLRQALDMAGPGSNVAIDLINTATGATLWRRQAQVPMPAPGLVSALTAAAARDLLPVGATLATRLVLEGTLRHQTVRGRLALVGGADPTLSLASLEALASQAYALGIRDVTGGVEVVDPGTGAPQFGNGWPVEMETLPGSPPTDSLSVGGDQVTVAVLPGAAPGKPVSATVVPLGSGLSVASAAVTTRGTANTLALTWDRGTSRFLLSGKLGADVTGGAVFLRTAPDPGILAGNLLVGALRSAGISVSGGVSRGPAPKGRAPLVAQVTSPTLSSLADEVLAAPNALAAEDLLSVLGGTSSAKTASPGAPAKGLARLRAFVAGEARATPAAQLYDGAGVSLYDRLAPQTAVTALLQMTAKASLKQMPNTLPLLASGSGGGTVRAVTGVGPGTACLSGYVTTASGAQVAVSVQIAGMTMDSARAEAMLTAVAQALRRLALVGVGVNATGG